MTSPVVVDAKGLTCPQPLMITKKALNKVAVGAIVEVHATDPGAADDLGNLCKAMGHEMLVQRQDGGVFVFEIKRGR